MNAEDLFRGLNYINAKYVDEAETATKLMGERKIGFLRKSVLIAMLIALPLMVACCGALVQTK